MWDQGQSSLGHFKLAPPPLAASEAIRRPGARSDERKSKERTAESETFAQRAGVWRRAGGRIGRRALGAEAPPFIPELYRPGRDESRLAGSAVHLPIGEGLGPLRQKTAVPARPSLGLAGCWSAGSAGSGLWGHGWLSLMYGKSPVRVLPLLLSLQLTGKNWRAPRIFYHCRPFCKDRAQGLKEVSRARFGDERRLQFILVQTSPKLHFGGLLWGSTLGKQV